MSKSVISQDYMKEVLRIQPKSLLFARYAYNLMQDRKYEQAFEVAKEGVGHFENYATGRFILAQCLIQRGDYNLAAEQLAAVLKLEPSYPCAIERLAYAYEQMDETDRSRATADLLLRYNHKSPLLRALTPRDDGALDIKEILEEEVNWEQYAATSSGSSSDDDSSDFDGENASAQQSDSSDEESFEQNEELATEAIPQEDAEQINIEDSFEDSSAKDGDDDELGAAVNEIEAADALDETKDNVEEEPQVEDSVEETASDASQKTMRDEALDGKESEINDILADIGIEDAFEDSPAKDGDDDELGAAVNETEAADALNEIKDNVEAKLEESEEKPKPEIEETIEAEVEEALQGQLIGEDETEETPSEAEKTPPETPVQAAVSGMLERIEEMEETLAAEDSSAAQIPQKDEIEDTASAIDESAFFEDEAANTSVPETEASAFLEDEAAKLPDSQTEESAFFEDESVKDEAANINESAFLDDDGANDIAAVINEASPAPLKKDNPFIANDESAFIEDESVDTPQSEKSADEPVLEEVALENVFDILSELENQQNVKSSTESVFNEHDLNVAAAKKEGVATEKDEELEAIVDDVIIENAFVANEVSGEEKNKAAEEIPAKKPTPEAVKNEEFSAAQINELGQKTYGEAEAIKEKPEELIEHPVVEEEVFEELLNETFDNSFENYKKELASAGADNSQAVCETKAVAPNVSQDLDEFQTPDLPVEIQAASGSAPAEAKKSPILQEEITEYADFEEVKDADAEHEQSDFEVLDNTEQELNEDEKKAEPISEKEAFEKMLVGEDAAQLLPDHILTPTFAQIYLEQGQPYLAKQIYERLLSQDPENDTYAEELEKINGIVQKLQSGEDVVIETRTYPDRLSANPAKKNVKSLKGKRIKPEIREILKEEFKKEHNDDENLPE